MCFGVTFWKQIKEFFGNIQAAPLVFVLKIGVNLYIKKALDIGFASAVMHGVSIRTKRIHSSF